MSGKMDACVSGEFILVHRWFVSHVLKEKHQAIGKCS